MANFKEFIEHKDEYSGEVWVTFQKTNRKKESISLKFYKDKKNRLLLQTFVKDTEGNVWGKYNPTLKSCIITNGRGEVVRAHSETVLSVPFTEENRQKVINEVANLFYEEA